MPLRGELVDGLGQRPREVARGLLRGDTGLLGDLVQGLVGQRLLDLLTGDGLVLPGADPGVLLLGEPGLGEHLQQPAQRIASRTAPALTAAEG